MNTNTTLSKESWIQLNQRQAARTGILLLLLLLLTLPTVVQAQFNYTINNGAVTITGYTGPGGSVIIPDTIGGLPVTSIGYGAFNGSTSLTSVEIPGSVTSIGDYAFDFCTNLTSVTIPNIVTNIGNEAFAECWSLANVTIGNGVTSIEFLAFYRCYSLTSITIPNSVTNIVRWAFDSCTSLTAIIVDVINPVYSSVAGVLFNKSQTTLVMYPGGKAGSYTIPNGVTSIGDWAFAHCANVTSVTIPNSVTSIGDAGFQHCTSLTNVSIPNSISTIVHRAFYECANLTRITIPDSVTSIGSYAFASSGLTSVTIPNSVTSIGEWAFATCINLANVTIGKGVPSLEFGTFEHCYSLTGVYFQGNAPSLGGSYVFYRDNNATVYYLPGTTGWDTTFGGRPTVLWDPPAIQASPQTQTAEAGSAVGLRVKASGSSPLFCLWYLNYTNLISSSTSRELNLTNVQLAQSGAYTVVVTNMFGAVTSAPALLNVIAAVEHRPVPGVQVTGEVASLWNVDYANSLTPAPNWTTLGSVSLISTSQYYFDLSLPLPSQRFYRAWQMGTPSVMPSLDLHIVPAITLTGSIGHTVRLDCINQFGPIDAWVTLATVPLTNTSQLYFDISAPGQPPRLYRIVPVP
jgi:BspA type Leucine rich repeat region (6 copies)/Immunoglobulin domain